MNGDRLMDWAIEVLALPFILAQGRGAPARIVALLVVAPMFPVVMFAMVWMLFDDLGEPNE